MSDKPTTYPGWLDHPGILLTYVAAKMNMSKAHFHNKMRENQGQRLLDHDLARLERIRQQLVNELGGFAGNEPKEQIEQPGENSPVKD